METKVAIYKDKKYRLLWEGQTKYGRRARLAFFSGDKDFWVNACDITIAHASTGGHTHKNAVTKVCWECGRTFTYAQCRENDGDWNDSYCGC